MLTNLIRNFIDIDIGKLRPDNFYDDFLKAKQIDVERIEKGSGWQEWNACPICGSQKSTIEFDCIGINIVKCLNCCHRYTDKIPINTEEVYDSEQYLNNVENFDIRQKDYRMNRFGKERVEIVKKLFNDTNRNVLDVGSGWGFFLHLLKEAGFHSYGIELSKSVADISKKEFNLDIVSVPIEEYCPDKEFDIITLFEVIEHVKNPVEVLSHCKELLKKNGYILLFTPNFESAAIRIQKEDANMIYPGQHLHHFTMNSMEKLSELIQMKIHSFQTKGLDIGDISSYYKYKGKKEIASFLYDNAVMLQGVIDEAKCANDMRVILQK